MHGMIRQDLEPVRGSPLGWRRPAGATSWARGRVAEGQRSAVGTEGELPALLPLRARPPPARGRRAVPGAARRGPGPRAARRPPRGRPPASSPSSSTSWRPPRRPARTERERVVAALNVLAEHLLAHLELEEESIGPALRRMDRHPLWREPASRFASSEAVCGRLLAPGARRRPPKYARYERGRRRRQTRPCIPQPATELTNRDTSRR